MKTIVCALLPFAAASCFADFRVVPPQTDVPYAPVKQLTPVGLSLKDGVMYKQRLPHFWMGNGDADASTQQGHSGIWLAWLQGADAVTLNHGMRVHAKRVDEKTVEVWDVPDLAIQCWRREAVRLGLLCNFFHSHEPGTGGQTVSGDAYKLSLADPELHEVYYHVGHHLGWDTGSDRGLDFSLTHRSALFNYLKNDPLTAYMEIAREPGANPTNERVRRDFRAWAQKKYGDLAAADAIWGVQHESWDDVQPPHLDKKRFPAKKSYEDILMRNRARNEAPLFYADWHRFLQDDTTRMMDRELTALRKLAPWAPVTVDVRGHTSRDDSYAAFVPERISPFVDLFSIHYGTLFYDFGNRPWDRASVLSETAAPLLWESYFRVNSDGAIVNSENIFGDARAALSDVDRMRENDMGQLCRQKWRIARDSGVWRETRKWSEPDFDDSTWDEITVPGCWDHEMGTAYEGFRGTCWLRRTFTVSGARKQDFVDGSCVFKLIGRGVAQQGDVWLNGHKLNQKKVAGWSSPYSFDVGAFINWGGRNVLVWRVDGMDKSDNGLRFESYILTSDQLSKPVPHDERMARFMLFQHLMGGMSGNWMWHWHGDGIRAYSPRLKAQLNAVAEAVLPELRHRRGKVAYLFAYNNGPGLPFGGDDRHFIDYYDALVFAGANPDAFGEERFRRDVTPEKYPLLVVPMMALVEDATYAHFKDYVAGGGTAIVTDGSFLKTTARYAATDFADYVKKGDFGKGRVVMMSSKQELGGLIDAVRPYLPADELVVTPAASAEKPLIERILCGNADRQVLYLANWGGLEQKLDIKLPAAVAGWRLTPVVGSFVGGARVTVPPQDVAVAILTRPGAQALAAPKVSPVRQAKLDELAAQLAKLVPCEKADVVFVGSSVKGPGSRGGRVMGLEKHPEILRVLARFGLTWGEVSTKGIKPECLASAKLVILPEGNSNAGVKPDRNAKGPLRGILEDFVRRGGSLLVLTDSAGSRNCDALALREIANTFGVTKAKAGAPRDDANGSFGDPFQVVSADIPASPLSEGVKQVQLYRLCPLRAVGRKQLPEGVKPFSVVNVKGGSAAMAGTCGEGRFFICSDISVFAPLRIDRADNAALLANTLGWLLKRPADDAARKQCREGLFLTERDYRRILAEEAR